MISFVEVLNYRCLRYVRMPLERFHVLAGPNASGKSTFLEVPHLVDRFVQLGLDYFDSLPGDLRDILWTGQGNRFEVAIESILPEPVRRKLNRERCEALRYEFSVGYRRGKKDLAILAETVWLKPSDMVTPRQPDLFPESVAPPETILTSGRRPRGWRKVVNKVSESGNDYYLSETTEWNSVFRLGPQRSALGNLPADETRWPACTWFKEYVSEGVVNAFLDPDGLAAPSYKPGARPWHRDPSGSWLPWLIHGVRRQHPDRFEQWLKHIRTVLPDVRAIKSVVRREDRKRYVVLEYETGLKLPSWAVSSGTLRLLALTLFAYLPDFRATLLIDEPENGIHPLAIQAVYDSLSTAPDLQVLLATHSPILLGLAPPEHILCFGKSDDGAVDIVRGSMHPKLRNWRGQPGFDLLFASGILG